MNPPVNKSTLAAECRSLWRAVYAARIQTSSSTVAAGYADTAVAVYQERYKTKDAV